MTCLTESCATTLHGSLGLQANELLQSASAPRGPLPTRVISPRHKAVMTSALLLAAIQGFTPRFRTAFPAITKLVPPRVAKIGHIRLYAKGVKILVLDPDPDPVAWGSGKVQGGGPWGQSLSSVCVSVVSSLSL